MLKINFFWTTLPERYYISTINLDGSEQGSGRYTPTYDRPWEVLKNVKNEFFSYNFARKVLY